MRTVGEAHIHSKSCFAAGPFVHIVVAFGRLGMFCLFVCLFFPFTLHSISAYHNPKFLCLNLLHFKILSFIVAQSNL